MGIFDFLKFKTGNDDFPSNELEKYLIKASKNRAFEPRFYELLLESEISVITDSDSIFHKGITFQPGDTIKLFKLESGEIPIFSSKSRIFDRGLVKWEVYTYQMKGSDLFTNSIGSNYVLNPYSNIAKRLNKHEVAAILDGIIFNNSHQRTLQKETNALFKEAEDVPKGMIDAMIDLFKTIPSVINAYIVTFKLDNSFDLPHLLMAIECETNPNDIIQIAGPLAEKYLKKDDIIDFIHIKENESMSNLIQSNFIPFYSRINY